MRTRKSLVAFLALLVAIAGIVVSGLGTTAAGAASIRNAGVIPSAGCGTSTVRGGETTVSTNSGGVQRDYIRHVPPAHDGVSPRPLVLSIHGLAEGPVIHAATTKWADRADAFGFVVAFPRGIDARWSLASGSADVVFLTQLLDELESQLCIDTNRVYMEGYSLGALMTSRLSCTLADRLAAVAPLAGTYAVSGCAPSKPVPLLTFHGTLDTFIPYEPIPGQVADWATRNGCTGPAAATDVPGDAVVTITKFTYPCPAGAEVQFYSIENGGHSWLGSEFSRSIESVIGYTTFAINATDLMWQFFRQHQVHPDVATYTARFTAAQGAMLARIAATPRRVGRGRRTQWRERVPRAGRRRSRDDWPGTGERRPVLGDRALAARRRGRDRRGCRQVRGHRRPTAQRRRAPGEPHRVSRRDRTVVALMPDELESRRAFARADRPARRDRCPLPR